MIKRKLIAKAMKEFKLSGVPETMLREAIIKKVPLMFSVKGVNTLERDKRLDYKLRTIEEFYKHIFVLCDTGYETYLIVDDSFPECQQLTKKLETLLANNGRNDNGHLFIIDVDIVDDETKLNKQIADICEVGIGASQRVLDYLENKTSKVKI